MRRLRPISLLKVQVLVLGEVVEGLGNRRVSDAIA